MQVDTRENGADQPERTIFPESGRAKRILTRALRGYALTLPAHPAPLPPPGAAPVRLLIQSMGGIGNTLMATPLVAALRGLYPAAQIDILTTPGAARFLEGNPHADAIIADQDGGEYSTAGYLRVQGILRRNRYDAALLTLNAVTFRFAIRTVLARVPIRAIHRYPFKPYDDYTPTFTHRVEKDPARHDVENNLALLREITGTAVEPGPLAIALDETLRAAAAEALGAQGWDPARPAVGLCPGSSGWMAFKRWPLEHYIDLARAIIEASAEVQVLVFTGPEELGELPAWEGAGLGNRCRAITGLPPRGYAAAIERCACIVTNDSLPMHLAAAVQCPVVALFGPTNPVQTGPWQTRARVLTPEVDFIPYLRIPYPLDPGQFPPCMHLITPDQVAEAVFALMGASR